MYYSFKCTYCGRVYYVYDKSRENASLVLYRSIKQHLIEYNEDYKEYEMDDGEQIDSNQIYVQMHESKEPPPGGYEATVTTSPVDPNTPPATASVGSSNSSQITIFFLLLIIGGLIAAYFFIPELRTFLQNLLPQ